MPLIFILSKLLVLEILYVTGKRVNYDIGYAPSVEEYDQFMSESNILAKSAFAQHNMNQRFIPKYKFLQPKKKMPPTDLQLTENVNSVFSINSIKPVKPTDINKPTHVLKESGKLNMSSVPLFVTNQNNVQLNTYSKEKFPIIFTNPTTGISYAITELGKVPSKAQKLHENASIPIYISKEQYERDLYLQRKYFEKICTIKQKNDRKTGTVTTEKGLIFSTKKPLIMNLETASILTTPPPVIVQKILTVKDQKQL